VGISVETSIGLIPFAVPWPPPAGEPSHFAYGLVEAAGDSSGGQVTMALTAPTGFFYRLEACSVFASDAAADVGNWHARAFVEWIKDALPVSNVLLEASMSSQAFIATRSDPNAQDMAAWVQLVRRVPLGRLSGPDAQILRFIGENNVNAQAYTLEAWFTGWQTPSLGIPGFLTAFDPS